MPDGGEGETKEVPVPRDITVTGAWQRQGKAIQVFMMAAGVALIWIASTGVVDDGNSFAFVIGGFALGLGFERLQWKVMADYGSWAAAAKEAVGVVR